MQDTQEQKFNNKLCLTTRGRFVMTLFIACIVLVVLGTLMIRQATPSAVAAHTTDEDSYQKIMITPGDTLWTISARLANSTDDELDDVLNKIVEYNDLESSELRVGEMLHVPVVE